MPHEAGSYLKELEEEHRKGDHKNRPDDNCQTCRDQDDEQDAREMGFESHDAYQNFVAEQCNRPDPELETTLDEYRAKDHRSGSHGKYPDRNCLECIKQHGINNI